MIIMLDEDFDEIESAIPDKTLIEQIAEILDRKSFADCRKNQDSNDISGKNECTTEKAVFWSEKFAFEPFFPVLKNDKNLNKSFAYRSIH